MKKKTATLSLNSGLSVEIPLAVDGSREVALLYIDNVPYHFERLKKTDFVRQYHVDADPSFKPSSDSKGNYIVNSL